MPNAKDYKDQWYVVQVLSGMEGKVRDRIARQVEAEEMQDYIREVLVPMEVVSEIKRGKKTETKKKFFPGYIIVNMYLATEDNQLVEKTWFFIKEMDGVIGFAGTKDRPAPMRPREVEAMLSQIQEREETVRPAISFEVGDTVKVGRRPFPISERNRRGNRSRAWQASCRRRYLRTHHSCRTRILAGRTRVSGFSFPRKF